jgi:2-keto-4-pentenoate hydratase/2-oxohepta-3-ene-1,7-dioic acid hydratase in catechol pathway
MYWTSYIDGAGHHRVGVLKEGKVHALVAGVEFLDILVSGTPLAEWGRQALADPDRTVDANVVRPAALLHHPPSIRDFMAFEEHVVTSNAALGLPMDSDWYNLPVFYFSNPAAIKAPHEAVRIAPGSQAFDYELEFAAVIGKPGADIAVEDAEGHIAGYMVMCDWSARDLQEREMRQTLGPAKGKDTATTLGPYMVTPDELAGVRKAKAFDVTITAQVNGRPYSEGNLADLYWSFSQMISYASRGTELRPGDVIGSGTVGTGCILELSRVHGTETYPYLRAGDLVRIDAGPLGVIQSRIQPASSVLPLH